MSEHELSATEAQRICHEASRRGWCVEIIRLPNRSIVTFKDENKTLISGEACATDQLALKSACAALFARWQSLSDDAGLEQHYHWQHRSDAPQPGVGLNLNADMLRAVLEAMGDLSP